jgi:ABC-2 type transport system ATP-binding protein
VIVTLTDARVGDGPAPALPAISLSYGGPDPVVAVAETELRPTVLSLVASGRMRIDGGSIALDGDDSDGVAARVAERVALVDTPRINEPADDVTLRAVVAEELALAGHRSGRHEVGVILDDQGLADLARAPFSAVPAVARIRLLTTLAASRAGVEAVVVTSPERHGGAVGEWMRVLRDLARAGTGVLVVTSESAAEAIAALPADDAIAAPATPEPTPSIDGTLDR